MFPFTYRPKLMGLRRRPQGDFPDKGWKDDEDHWMGFTSAEGKREYIALPSMGQGKSQRHTNKIKIWSISCSYSLHVLNCTNPETIGVEIILMWAFRPNGGAVPKYEDLFTGGDTMDDQHNPMCAKLKHPMTKFYKVLKRVRRYLTPYTTQCGGVNRCHGQINLKFRGRNAKYITFGEESTGGSYTDCVSGGFFYYVRFICSDRGAKLEGDWNARIIYYH